MLDRRLGGGGAYYRYYQLATEIMEQMPHHREGIQNELDKAYDEAHQDNAWRAYDKAIVSAERKTHISDEEMQSKLSTEEKQWLLNMKRKFHQNSPRP